MNGFREVVVDLDAIEANTRRMVEVLDGAALIAVVKADGYGHGALPAAEAALRGGAAMLATAELAEAELLRDAGIDARLLCWLHGPDTPFDRAARRGIELGVSSARQLERAAEAGATVHLKLETGLGRNGIAPGDWPGVFARAAQLEAAGASDGFRVAGVMTHLSNTSPEDDREALALFRSGVDAARAAGLDPELVHAAASAAAIDLPESRFTAARIGLALYGLSPFDDERDSAALGLRPAMSLRATVIAVRRVAAGHGVSYGYLHRTEQETGLALVPLGYADGVPRQASTAGVVTIGGREYPQRGRIAMDQFVVETGDDAVAVGDEAVLFGDPSRGEPAVERWADAANTINYEIVTRMGARPGRVYRGGTVAR
ncbi:alanine racemase [Mycetocola reblochoni]|uniref:alanine racemase n=1 Tax=Mycetocola reblochoni TaxID=331618 RepID=UPI003F9AFDFC